MDIYLISDTHFQHENMYKFIGYDGVTRVRHRFEDTTHGDEFMIEMWNQTVKPKDHVYHLGDVAMNSRGVQLVKRLNGHKRLVLGNHDREKMTVYMGVGFQKIFGSRNLNGLFLTHIPVHSNHVPSKVFGNVHGHIHERPSPEGPYFNVSVEQINYTPIHFEVVRDYLRRKKVLGEV